MREAIRNFVPIGRYGAPTEAAGIVTLPVLPEAGWVGGAWPRRPGGRIR